MTDRADVVARAILQMIAHHSEDRVPDFDDAGRIDCSALLVEIATCLRDEFADERRQTLNEIRREDE